MKSRCNDRANNRPPLHGKQRGHAQNPLPDSSRRLHDHMLRVRLVGDCRVRVRSLPLKDRLRTRPLAPLPSHQLEQTPTRQVEHACAHRHRIVVSNATSHEQPATPTTSTCHSDESTERRDERR